MAGSGDTNVHLPDLKEHENALTEIMSGVRAAVDAGGQGGTFFDGAFGIVGQPVSWVMQIWLDAARDALTQVSTTGQEITTKISDSHKCYADNEKDCKKLFTDIDKGQK